MKQQIEWQKAQKIVITEDLVAAAKQHLRFLAEVDRNQYLYGGPILDRAIYRCQINGYSKREKLNNGFMF